MEAEHAERCVVLAKNIAKLEGDVVKETARAIKAEGEVLNAMAAHGGLGERLAKETERANKAEANLRAQNREKLASDNELLKAKERIADVEEQLKAATERARRGAYELAACEDEKCRIREELDEARVSLAALEETLVEEAEKGLKHEADLVAREKEQVQTLNDLVEATAALAASREGFAKVAEEAEKSAQALRDAQAAHADLGQKLAAQTERAEKAEAKLKEGDQQRQILDAISHEADDLRASLEESKTQEESSRQRVKELEDEVVEIQGQHEKNNQVMDKKLSELYELVEQQKEAGDQSFIEAEQSKQEAQTLRSALVLARYDYFCKLLLVQDFAGVDASGDVAAPKRAVFAKVLEEREGDTGTVDANQGSMEDVGSQSASHDTTFGPEGFETLPPLHMSSRKQR